MNIMHCIEIVRMYVYWNRKNLEWFKPTREVRQGDYISPYLFVLCMERLRHIINQAVVAEGRWKPIRLSRNGPPLSHLFFADDLLIFADAFEDQINVIMNCMNNFCNLSGQKSVSTRQAVGKIWVSFPQINKYTIHMNSTHSENTRQNTDTK